MVQRRASPKWSAGRCRSRLGTRPISTPFRPSRRSRRDCARPSLSSHLARVRLQEAAGRRRNQIFDYARVYRNREGGPLHTPEFTMLEWYRAGEPYEAVMNDCVELCRWRPAPSGATFRMARFVLAIHCRTRTPFPGRSLRPVRPDRPRKRCRSTHATCSQTQRSPPVSVLRTTTAGLTSSAAYWCSTSSPSWGRAG